MSAPHQFAIEAQNIGYGILASSLTEILKAEPGQPLDDRTVIWFRQGVDFIQDVIRGAQAVAQGEFGALTTEKSIEALGYAIEPASALLHEALIRDEDLVRIFEEIADFLSKVIEGKHVMTTDHDNETKAAHA